ncbi:uncharacterized protein PAC_07865 [Phialocephala subalpina]|uniref:AB hydrolase-1 domain-containing protein n=1 Tax=Phialocephala subalpina TaxID=576137 RepID=A0A1L7WYY1_9HELO|nr:uncharacterized protein PAC_07865 [Phialocephala subalpina]
MSKPTIVMVPGAWHKPVIYNNVASHLQKYGYSTVLQPLPSAGAIPPNQDFTQDVTAIRKRLTSLISEGKEIVLVIHSYAGLPGSEACKGLGKKEREAKGEKGGLIRFVCLNAFAMLEGFQPTPRGQYAGFPDWMKIDVENDITTVTRDDAFEIFYHDLHASEAEKWISQLEPHQSLGVYSSTLTYAAWKDIPSTYLQGVQDRSVFTQEAVGGMLGAAREVQPSAFDVVERCEEGGHCMMVSFPEWTAGALRRAAGPGEQHRNEWTNGQLSPPIFVMGPNVCLIKGTPRGAKDSEVKRHLIPAIDHPPTFLAFSNEILLGLILANRATVADKYRR